MQGTYAILVGTVTVLIILVLIAMIARQYRESGGIDGIAKILPAFFVVIMAVIILGQIADVEQDDQPDTVSYSFDASTGTLTISSDIPDGYRGPWNSYAGNVKSLVIDSGVDSIGTGAFLSLTSLKSLTMPDGVSLGDDALGVELKDVFGESTEAGGEYAGLGSGTLYLCDPGVFTYSNDMSSITGLTVEGDEALVLVIPGIVAGIAVTSIADGNSDNTILNGGYTTVLHTSDQRLEHIGDYTFSNCTSLASVDIPSSVTSIGKYAFRGCTSLASVDIPSSVTSIGTDAFRGCTSLASVDIPSSVTSIGDYLFSGCTSLASVDIPSSVTRIGANAFGGCRSLASVDIPSSVTSIGANAFTGCSGMTHVSFGDTFAATLGSSWANSWTFYDTDGTTVIDKTVAANLAGSTFEGTAAALVKVFEGMRSLTLDQIQKVRLHDTELQDLKDQITLDPLPFQPSLQEEGLVAA